MTDYIVDIDENNKETQLLLAEKIFRCNNCQYYRSRIGMCDIWHCHTPHDGYCHRAKSVKIVETE